MAKLEKLYKACVLLPAAPNFQTHSQSWYRLGGWLALLWMKATAAHSGAMISGGPCTLLSVGFTDSSRSFVVVISDSQPASQPAFIPFPSNFVKTLNKASIIPLYLVHHSSYKLLIQIPYLCMCIDSLCTDSLHRRQARL